MPSCVLAHGRVAAATRNASGGGGEPSDAIRVVNALLTQLDQLKRYSNALVLTTSNLTGAIDAAFIDRADIKQYIGHLAGGAVQILRSCVHESAASAWSRPDPRRRRHAAIHATLPHAHLRGLMAVPTEGSDAALQAASRYSTLLYAVAEACGPLRLRPAAPFLARASAQTARRRWRRRRRQYTVDAISALVALRRAVEHERGARRVGRTTRPRHGRKKAGQCESVEIRPGCQRL